MLSEPRPAIITTLWMGLNSLQTVALIDSGSTYSLFDYQLGVELGMDVRSGRVQRLLEEMMGLFVSKPPQQSLEEWARELLGDISLSDDDEFVDGLTVREYFSLSEKGRDKLWEKWQQEAEVATKNVTARKVLLDANTNR